MPTYTYSCPQCGEFDQMAGYNEAHIVCNCQTLALRLPCSGVQVINRTGDLGRPVTWAEKRHRESNARVQETVTNNSKMIAKETGQKHGAGLK